MSCTIIFDWKSLAAKGVTAIGLILVIRDPDAAKEALVHVSDAVKECAIACQGNC